MNQELYRHLGRFIEMDKDRYENIIKYFDHLSLNKKETVISANKRCDKLYFVSKGCLYMYFIDDKGVEKTVQFAIENWWITDFLAFHHQTETDFYVQAVEASEVLCITYDKQQELFAHYPEMEGYFRKIYEVAYGAAIRRLKYIFNYSKEEIFYQFGEQFPEFVNRVPQYLIATYLGLTPEYLSKLRSKKLS